MKDVTKGGFVAGIFWIIGVSILILGGIALIVYISMPVMEMVGEALGIFGSALNIGQGSALHSFAALCIVLIGIIGIIRVLTRRK